MSDHATTVREEPTGRKIPRIISVDDHILEPPDLWTARLPSKYAGRAPRVVRERGNTAGFTDDPRNAGFSERKWAPSPDGSWADVWYYDDLVVPLTTPYAAAGMAAESHEWKALTYDEIRPGCWSQKDRLADMDLNHTDASACFPNFLTRFCGQTFFEREDKEFALLCLRAYNDWIIDEWCSGDGAGRLIPITIVPLWDPVLAAQEVRRCSSKGSHAISFIEMPTNLGLPSWYSGHWDPVLVACNETETTVCMHVGSSGFATTVPDAPQAAQMAISYQYGMYSLIDCTLSGLFERFPSIKVMYSEANVGWMPFLIERMDLIWRTRGEGMTGRKLPRPPSEYIAKAVWGCVVDDEVGLMNRDRIGMDRICYESDYPHSASFWPDSQAVALRLADNTNLDAEDIYKFVRGNAINAFGLERFGITD
jgi:predicted TIM-barrel fold metal-dependent hydrolase